MKVTKTFLNKFIKWTSSRYNVAKKSDIINEIYNGLKQGYITQLMWKPKNLNFEYIPTTPLKGQERIYKVIYQRIYSCGSYCPCSSMASGGDYIVNFKEKTIVEGFVNDKGDMTKIIGKITIC